MKAIQKYFCLILCTILLISVALLAASKADTSSLFFLVQNPGKTNAEKISIFDAQDGNYYVFLPAYAEMERTILQFDDNHHFSLGGINLHNGMTCDAFHTETPYAFTIDDQCVATLWFYRSKNIPAMYIDTATGRMDNIHTDKHYKEDTTVTLYSDDGQVTYSTQSSTLNIRGNSSLNLPKKQYSLTLSQGASLLGMKESTQWVLQGNGYDSTQLRNKLVYNFAAAVSDRYTLSPDCTYVELYLNGIYNGLYLLCEKITPESDAFALEANDFYFELTLGGRIANVASAFNINQSQGIQVLHPTSITSSQLDMLEAHISEFQNALYSSNPALTDRIDMESWARKYLVEEIFSNYDSGRASQFFLLDSSEQKIYAGHYWDYDLTFGEYWGTDWSSPNCLLAQRNWYDATSWYYALCQNDEFIELVIRLYETEYRPLLLRYADHEIQDYASGIEAAIPSESLRWSFLYSATTWTDSVNTIVDHLTARIKFLDSIWVDKDPYCTITFQTTETYNLCVPANTVCNTLPQPADFNKSGQWYLSGTKIPFDASTPITEDIVLVTLEPEQSTDNSVEPLATRDYITFLSIAALLVLMAGHAWIDVLRRVKERRMSREHRRRKVSP